MMTGGAATGRHSDPMCMTASADCPLAGTLARHLREGREAIVDRWLERIASRVNLAPGQIFPTPDLLNHMPLLVDGIADYLEDPAEEITADIPVVAKAMELGEMRYVQGFDAYQILKEYEVLGGVLFDFLINTVDDIDEPCTRGELLICSSRLFRSIIIIQQFTTTHFLRLADERVREREERLRGLNRAVTHELKDRMGAASGAAVLLEEDHVVRNESRLRRLASIVKGSVDAMKAALEGLAELSRLDSEEAQSSNVLLADSAEEVKRQLRELAEDRGVRVDLADDLPEVEVPAAAVELALSNYITNSIKYRDVSKPDRWVLVEAEVVESDDECELRVWVSDNGIGVPEESRGSLFKRHFRAHDHSVTGEEGTGLGLSIVRDNIEALGGRVWAEFPAEGSRFAFALPCTDENGGEPTPSGAKRATRSVRRAPPRRSPQRW